MGIVGYSRGGADSLCALINYENGKVSEMISNGRAAYLF